MRTPEPGLRIRTRPGHPDFLDLPWEQPLEEWQEDRLIDVTRGVHRHVVKFVNYGSTLYALKELPNEVATREYRLLRQMAEESLPVVDAIGVVTRPRHLDNVLITRFLDFSLPYRFLFITSDSSDAGIDVEGLSSRLLDALAMLLVRLHLAGFYWGDCSLSNTLFRRDAGALAAYLVDMETGEWHPELTDGQREADLQVTELNVAGGLMDVQSELDLPPDPDPVETAADLRRRYDRLWDELRTEAIIDPDQRHMIESRVRRLNELGFDVDEVEVASDESGEQLVLRTQVSEQGFHRRRLLTLTGLAAQENQARSLLNDMANFRFSEERKLGRQMSEQVAAFKWLTDIFEPTVNSVPDWLLPKREPVEVFHEVIEHKWQLSQREDRDVDIWEAVESYMANELPELPDERLVLLSEEDGDFEGYIGYG